MMMMMNIVQRTTCRQCPIQIGSSRRCTQSSNHLSALNVPNLALGWNVPQVHSEYFLHVPPTDLVEQHVFARSSFTQKKVDKGFCVFYFTPKSLCAQ